MGENPFDWTKPQTPMWNNPYNNMNYMGNSALNIPAMQYGNTGISGGRTTATTAAPIVTAQPAYVNPNSNTFGVLASQRNASPTALQGLSNQVSGFFGGLGDKISNGWNSLFGSGKNDMTAFNKWNQGVTQNGNFFGFNDFAKAKYDSFISQGMNPNQAANALQQMNTQNPELFKAQYAAWSNEQQALNRNAPTGLDYANFGVNLLSTGLNAWMGYKGLKAQTRALEENLALQRANFKNQARTVNAQYRDQMSGRGRVGDSAANREALSRNYKDRKLEETY